MWRPIQDLEAPNRDLIELEQLFLAVLRRTRPLRELIFSSLLDRICHWIDDNPYQAALMARIKGSHAMTPRHGINVMLLARAWAVHSHKLGYKLNDFSLAALFHDLGHWRSGDLTYVFGHFSHEEAMRLRDHVLLDQESDTADLNDEIKLWIRQHHEQPDGKGYPEGIKNPHILAQLLRIADCFEGLTTPRRFRSAHSYPKAMAIMSRWTSYKYKSALFKSFSKFLGHYPVGSFIQLKSDEVGVTLPSRSEALDCIILTNAYGEPFSTPKFKQIEATQVKGEASPWRTPPLPDEWKNLRPDLLSLPRSY